MMMNRTMNHRTAKPGTTQPPRSGDTDAGRAAARNQIEGRAGRRDENTTGRAQRGRGAQRSTRNKTTAETLTRRKACRGARAARGSQPQARKHKEDHDAGKHNEEQDGQRIGKHEGRGAQPRVLLICPTDSCHHPFARRPFGFFIPGPRLPPGHHRAPPVGGAGEVAAAREGGRGRCAGQSTFTGMRSYVLSQPPRGGVCSMPYS